MFYIRRERIPCSATWIAVVVAYPSYCPGPFYFLNPGRFLLEVIMSPRVTLDLMRQFGRVFLFLGGIAALTVIMASAVLSAATY